MKADETIEPGLKVFPLYNLNVDECFPAGFNRQFWYGIYFISSCDTDQPGTCPSIVLLHNGFDFVTQHTFSQQQGFLILFNHRFLPKRLNEKLRHLPLFFQQGRGPFTLNLQQVLELNMLFEKIYSELPSEYPFKKELLATLVMQLIHFVIKNFT